MPVWGAFDFYNLPAKTGFVYSAPGEKKKNRDKTLNTLS